MVELHGFCDERFAPIGEMFRSGIERGTDEGASFAISMNGELVVDLWGGYRDLARTRPWEADTLVRVASTSKVIVAIAVLMLWDRGQLDLDEPIATYWPEFAHNGKAAISTRQVLLQRSGLPGFGCTPTADDWRSWERMIAITERAPAWYEPGTITCYHSSTFGYILGELVHRISGVPFTRFVADEITGPVGGDFHLAVSVPRDVERCSEIWIGEMDHGTTDPMALRMYAEEAALPPLVSELVAFVSPGVSGIANARALERIGSIMALGGEVQGRRYLSRQTIAEACREHGCAEDLGIGAPLRRGLFFALDTELFPAPTPTTIHWGGYGGSWLTMDPGSGISCAYTPNKWLTGDEMLRCQAFQWRVLTEVLRDIR